MGTENHGVQLKDPPDGVVQTSLSGAVSTSSYGLGQEDEDSLGDVLIWGEGIGEGILGGGVHRLETVAGPKMDALLPKPLLSTVVLDVHNIACGGRHIALVTRQGEVFCWGEEFGGRLGHGIDTDISHPKLVESLRSTNVEFVKCGEYHTCAVTLSGDLYTWGDGTHGFGLLGHGNKLSHWLPKRVNGILDGLCVSYIACGPWHTALVTSAGQLFTFGDGTFGVLGHGDKNSVAVPREVESLKGLKTVRAACGVWHTAAVVEVIVGSLNATSCSSGKLFTWGDGDKGRLGHGDKEQKLVPACVAAIVEDNFCQVACGHTLTVALSTLGDVFTMGSPMNGQLGDSQADGKLPGRVKGRLADSFVEAIACGAHHVAVLTSKTEVYTWGKGLNGRLGHGDAEDRTVPTLVEALKDKQVKSIACGSTFTAVICLHKWVPGAEQLTCSGCRQPFSFTRKRHNCYNCGGTYCHACSSKKAITASLAPYPNKPYRVCTPCYLKLKKQTEFKVGTQASYTRNLDLHECLEMQERAGNLDIRLVKPQVLLSKPPGTENIKQAEGKVHITKQDSSSHVFPMPLGLLPWGTVNTPKKFVPIFASHHPTKFASSVPVSRTASRAVSPFSSRPSPPRSKTPTPTVTGLTVSKNVVKDLQKRNEALNGEIMKLSTQVGILNQRCDIQGKTLQQRKEEVQEALILANEETSRFKAAKEVIKSLTTQLRDIAERLHPGAYRNRKPLMAFGHHVLNEVHTMSEHEVQDGTNEDNQTTYGRNKPNPTMNAWDADQNRMSSLGSALEDSIPLDVPALSTDTDAYRLNSEKRSVGRVNLLNTAMPTDGHDTEEWVEQDQLGVYITVKVFPGGGKDLKRVRFSRKRFSEKQAEAWWHENRQRVQDQYNIRESDRTDPRRA
ncbi:hypothetical protein O6H91_Y347000 [Diphasiastrum complanatum]|nr:hypothetical protein O6H91_Y347000 [Diphasiastrum complanatum]KAJ7283112.1 hypothetical protein O6H91_Y347000 [Diphasiastrum complanatum]KAJ7283115.1 hypothetical protein O6H91_Y347000 [Diphasiastrum complanatum]